MKRVLGLLFLLLAPCMLAQNGSAVKTAGAPERRMGVAVAVVSYYTKEHPEPTPPVIYFNVQGLDAKEVLRLVGPRPIKSDVKAGDNYEARGGRLVDKDTGKGCDFFHLTFKEVTDGQTTVRVWWEGMEGSWCVYELVIKLVKDKWEIVEDRIEVVP